MKKWIMTGVRIWSMAWVCGVAGTVWADGPPLMPNDRAVASIVVGKDGARDVEAKLGQSPCLVPSLSGESLSYLYNVQSKEGHYYLRFEVNGHVDAITVSKDPPITGVCYAPVHHPVLMKTEQGLQLGATAEEVMHVYGRPNQSFSVGSMARYRYEGMLDRPYEWDLVFRNGRLVEWTVSAEEE